MTLVARGKGPVARVVRQLIYGPEPIGAADVAQLHNMTFGELDGGPLGGYVHYGMKGDPALTWSGLTASPQQFVGQAQMGKTSAIVVQAYPALPNAAPPAANRQWLQDWTELEELLS